MFQTAQRHTTPGMRRYARRFSFTGIAIGALLFIAACGGGAAPTATPAANLPNVGGLAGLAATATQLAKNNAAATTPTSAPTTAPTVAPTVVPTTAPTVAATATQPAAATATPLVAATARPANTPTVAASVRPANTPTVAFVGGSANSSWSDPKGRIQLNIPAGWKVGATQLDGFYGFDGPSGASMLIIVGTQTGTPTQESDAKRTSLPQNAATTYTFAATKDARVGTEQGKSFDFTTVPKSQPSATPQSDSSTIVNHSNTQYEFVGTNIGTRRADIDAFFASVVFLK